MKTTNDSLHNIQVSGFAYELIRSDLLPELIGKELSQILYWAGKNLARKYPLQTIDEIMDFFIQAGWGHLHLVHEKKSELEFELSSELITERHEQNKQTCYQLEAGFIAEQIQQQKKFLTEACEKPKKKSTAIILTIQWDPKDNIDNE
jgi:predicted hydrocarbon binding protein